MTLTPFADDAASVSIGKLTVENGTDQLALYGSLDITRDQQGLAHARALLAIVQAVVQRLEADTTLPAALPAAAKSKDCGQSVRVNWSAMPAIIQAVRGHLQSSCGACLRRFGIHGHFDERT